MVEMLATYGLNLKREDIKGHVSFLKEIPEVCYCDDVKELAEILTLEKSHKYDDVMDEREFVINIEKETKIYGEFSFGEVLTSAGGYTRKVEPDFDIAAPLVGMITRGHGYAGYGSIFNHETHKIVVYNPINELIKEVKNK